MRKHDAYKDSGEQLIGDIPIHWKVVKLNHLISESRPVTYGIVQAGPKLEEGVAYVRPADMTAEGIPSIDKLPKTSPEIAKPYKRSEIFENDIVVSIGPSFGKLAIVKPEHNGSNLTQGTARVAANEEVDHKYLYWVLSSLSSWHYWKRESVGATFAALSLEILKKTPSPLTEDEFEQTQIARYLDYKTAKIDALITKKQRLTELLEEERTAIINQAVTKGLDTNVPMKDSGIEWLGKIPEHWELSQLGYVSKVVRGASPRPAGDPLLFNGTFLPWITVKEVTNAKGKYIVDTESYLTELGAKGTRIVDPETLLLSNSGATLGVPRITKIRGGINDGSVAFIKLNLERDFLYHFLSTHTKIYRDEAAGSGQPNLNTDIVKSTKISLPPLSEQLKIISYIEQKNQKSEKINEKVSKEIELLKEYKTALISEVVTGKVDVRDEVIPN